MSGVPENDTGGQFWCEFSESAPKIICPLLRKEPHQKPTSSTNKMAQILFQFFWTHMPQCQGCLKMTQGVNFGVNFLNLLQKSYAHFSGKNHTKNQRVPLTRWLKFFFNFFGHTCPNVRGA